MRTLIVIDDRKTLLQEHEEEFKNVFGEDKDYEIITKFPEVTELDDFVRDIKNIIKEKLREGNIIVLLVDNDLTNAQVKFAGKNVLDKVSEHFTDEIKQKKLVCLFTTVTPFFDPTPYKAVRRCVFNEQQGIDSVDKFDRISSSPGIYRNTIDSVRDDVEDHKRKIKELLDSETVYGDYFGRVFAELAAKEEKK